MKIFFFCFIVWLEMCALSSPSSEIDASNLTAKGYITGIGLNTSLFLALLDNNLNSKRFIYAVN